MILVATTSVASGAPPTAVALIKASKKTGFLSSRERPRAFSSRPLPFGIGEQQACGLGAFLLKALQDQNISMTALRWKQ